MTTSSKKNTAPTVSEKERLTAKVLTFLKSPPRWFEWFIVGAFLIILAVTLTGQLTGGTTKISVSILGQTLTLETKGDKVTVPINVVIVDGVSYVRTTYGDVPLRFWLESQGYIVTWESATQSVIAEK